MALNVNAAKLYNRIIYTTDAKSYQKAKKDMMDLKKSFKGLKLSDSPMFARESVQAAKKAGRDQAKAYNDAFSAETQRASTNRKYKITFPKGSNNTSAPGADFSTAAQRAAYNPNSPLGVDPMVSRQTRQLAVANQVEKSDKEALQRSREALKLQKVQEQAYLKELSVVQKINMMTGLTNEQRDVAITKARNMLDQYSRQKTSLASVNGEMQLMLTEYRQINAEQIKLNNNIRKQAAAEAAAESKRRAAMVKQEQKLKKQREDEAYWNRRYGLGLIPGAAPLAFGAPGVAFAAAGASIYGGISAVGSSVRRNKELTEASRQSGLSTLEIQAISRSAMEHGLENFNVPKIADAVKDMNDKIGDFVNNAKINEKTGEWKGGGGLTDAANVLKLTMDQIKEFQDDPVGMVNLIVNRSKQLGLSQAQMVNLLESFGNDFSRLSYLFVNDGAGLIEAMNKINESGQSLTDAQREQIDVLRKWGLEVSHAGESLADHFTLGIANATEGTNGFSNSLMRLNPLMETLGGIVGRTITEFGKVLDFFTGFTLENVMKEDWSPSGIYNTLNDALNGFLFGGSVYNNSKNALFGGSNTPVWDGITNNSRNLWTSSAGYQNPNQMLQIQPTPVNITVTPDSQGFSDLIKVTSSQQIGDEFRNMTLSMYGSTTNNNN